MKKILTAVVFFLTVFLFGLKANVLYAQEYDCKDAPAVASSILREAGIKQPHPKANGNWISEVAKHMEEDKSFDGVDKCNECLYRVKVSNFLNRLGAEIDLIDEGINYENSGATAVDNKDGTVTLSITVADVCKNGISGLDPIKDFTVYDSVIGGPYYFGTSSIPGSELTKWSENNGVYEVTLERNYFSSRPSGYTDGWFRIWDIYVKGAIAEDNLELKTTYYMVGDWKLDLKLGTASYPRFIKINSHIDGNLEGLMGVGYDPSGVATGAITGSVNGQNITMHYDRTGYSTDGYTADFVGTIDANGNLSLGTWTDRDRGGVAQTWSMARL